MNNAKSLVLLSLFLASAVQAQSGANPAPAPAVATSPANTAPGSSVDMTEGEVRKIDKDNKKITLKHGEIKNLEMPAMTMVFQVSDASFLEKVKPGDKVRFRAAKEAGALVVTEIAPLK